MRSGWMQHLLAKYNGTKSYWKHAWINMLICFNLKSFQIFSSMIYDTTFNFSSSVSPPFALEFFNPAAFFSLLDSFEILSSELPDLQRLRDPDLLSVPDALTTFLNARCALVTMEPTSGIFNWFGQGVWSFEAKSAPFWYWSCPNDGCKGWERGVW